MSPSVFRGRPTITTYEYDQTGQVVRTVTRSAWTDEDRALMLARAQVKRSLCPGCGHPREKAWHPDNDGWFEVEKTITCHACTAERRRDAADAKPVEYPVVTYTRDETKKPLPLWEHNNDE